MGAFTSLGSSENLTGLSLSAVLLMEKCVYENRKEKEKWQTNIAPLRPPTLATFRSWGSSAGAGRADLPMQM